MKFCLSNITYSINYISNFVLQVSNLFKELNINNVTVQVEKETYYFHLSGLGANWENFNDFGSSKFYDTSKSIKDI